MSVVARVRPKMGQGSFVASLTLYDVAAAAVFVAILALAVVPRFDPDFWWHLFTGRHILQAGVPGTDFLSYTVRGHTWIDHEWLSEVGMFAAYKVGGMKLVLSLFGLITAGAFLGLFFLMKMRGVNALIALTLTIFAVIATIGSWGPRIQMISLLLTAVFCILLERYRATAARRWLVAIVVTMMLWANLHGGFAIGLVLMGLYLVGGVIDRIHGGMNWRQALRMQRPLGIAVVAAFVVTFLNPNTYHTALYPLQFLTPNAFTNVIQESQSPNFHLFQLLPFELMLVGLFVGGLLVRRRVSWIDILVTIVFTHLALQETRNVPLWCIAVIPIAAVYLQDACAPLVVRFSSANRPVNGRSLFLLNWLALAGVVIMGVVFMGKVDTPANVLAAEHSNFPSKAVNYLDSHWMWGRGFASYSYGGYLIWESDSRYPVFIDSRADTVYTDQVLADYLTVYNAQPRWDLILRRYQIHWVFVEQSAPIAAVLTQARGWKVVFRAQNSVIFEQK